MLSREELAFFYLRGRPWVKQLIDEVNREGGVGTAQPGKLFEVRFAYELLKQNFYSRLEYEFDAHVDGTTVDFFCGNDETEWLVELVGVNESDAVQRLRSESREMIGKGIVTETVVITSDADDKHETPEAESIRVAEILEGKVWNKRRSEPIKFPEPTPGRFHAVVVDMSGFEGSGDPDPWHCLEVLWGSRNLPPECRYGSIAGLFDQRNTRPGAKVFRERVHVVGFVASRCGRPISEDDIARAIFLVHNPHISDKGIIRRFPILDPVKRDPLYDSERRRLLEMSENQR
jgi:hypothetical protein